MPNQPNLFDTSHYATASEEPAQQQQPGTKLLEPQATRLAAALGTDVSSVTITDNRRTMLSWRKSMNGMCRVRMHHMFVDAPQEVLDAIRRAIHGDESQRTLVREFIAQNQDSVRSACPVDARARRRSLRPVGFKYDLREIHADVNRRFFHGESKAAVTWGSAIQKNAARSLRFGSYNPEANVITISRRLNARGIPKYLIEYIMFHEILHEIIGISRSPSGRRRMHTSEFRRRERQFPQLQKAKEFMKKRWGVK